MTKYADRLRERFQRTLLAWTVRPRRISRHVSTRAGRPGETLRRLDPSAVRLAAVQMRFEPAAAPEQYAEHVLALARRAVDDGAQLVAFPEDAALPLLGLLPGAGAVLAAPDLKQALSAYGRGVSVIDVLRFAGPAVERAYRAVFAAVARSLRVYVHAGSAMLPGRGDRVYNVAHLFAPDGRLLARSSKAHLLPLEAEWGLTPGEGLTVVDTLIGRIGLPVCMDATYWESFRILYLHGAEIAVLPTANPEPYDEWRALRGIWPRVQESPMYGLQSSLVGRVLGMTLTGKSGIYGPAELSPNGDGIWARMDDPEAEGVVVATVDLRQLDEHRRRLGLDRSFNLELYRRYLPAVYHRVARRMRQRAERAPGRPRGRGRR
ncbi:MAG TPA: nitrilase-related carbon-nitrogen hydrolase [Bacillota bacterium]